MSSPEPLPGDVHGSVELLDDEEPEDSVGRFVADAEALSSSEGSREIHTLVVGRSVTGVGAFVGHVTRPG